MPPNKNGNSNPKRSSNKKNNSKKTKKNASTKFLERSNIHIPPSFDEHIAISARGLEASAREYFQHEDPRELVKPLNVTPAIQKQIADLEISKGIWYAHCNTVNDGEDQGFELHVILVNKEHGSDGKALAESDGLGLHLGMCVDFPPRDGGDNASISRTKIAPLILGSIARFCLHPMALQHVFRPKDANLPTVPPQRPRKVLVQSEGTAHLISQGLQQMGILQVGVAEAALVQSAARYAMENEVRKESLQVPPPDPDQDPRAFRQYLAKSMMEPAYVSETRVPLRGWRPDEEGVVPLHWFARPPKPIDQGYRCTSLWGWRTNLERAVLQGDVAKIKDICQRYDALDIKEYCEMRCLLTNLAYDGKLASCRALLEDCNVAVDGELDPSTPYQWKEFQRQAGGDGTSPLHRAAHGGYAEVVTLLLTHGASLSLRDQKQMHVPAIHYAVSQGHLDCIRILCEWGSDLSIVDATGEDALSVSLWIGDKLGGPYVQLQEKVREILREFDPRCSNCQAHGQMKNCPCEKERYCNKACQVARWKHHKHLHRQLVASVVD